MAVPFVIVSDKVIISNDIGWIQDPLSVSGQLRGRVGTIYVREETEKVAERDGGREREGKRVMEAERERQRPTDIRHTDRIFNLGYSLIRLYIDFTVQGIYYSFLRL